MSLSPGAKAALSLWSAAIVWDMLCPPGETISEAIERGLNNRYTEPVVTALIIVTTAHLLRVVADNYDLYTVSFKALGRMVEQRKS